MTLYIFDKDKTLVKPIQNLLHLPVTPSKPEQQELYPGVREKLDHLRAHGDVIALASNQSLVANGEITYTQAVELMEDCVRKIGGASAYRISGFSPKAKYRFWRRHNPYARDDESRKPHPGMIIDLMNELGYSPEDVIMVGDKKADQKAAEGIGAGFISAQDFFDRPEQKASQFVAPTLALAAITLLAVVLLTLTSKRLGQK